MIKLAGALLLAAALPFAPASAANKAAHKPVARDWTKSVVATPEGGFRMGNAAAPVKLVEYGSLACPHCRHFEQTGYKPLLERYVRPGKVSYEFRNLLISGPDISVSLLTRCAGAANFFPMSSVIFATQPQWEQKLVALTSADRAEIEKMTDQQRFARFAEVTGMKQIAARFGVTPVRARQCLADPKGLERLLAMTQAANAIGVTHTPSFIVNGKLTDATTWEQLEPLLREAAGHS